MRNRLHIHHVHLQRTHYIKIVITTGCMVSSMMLLMIPGYEQTATLIATATNVLWVWT